MDWKLGLPVLVGQKVLWFGNVDNHPQTGTVKWIGKIASLGSSWYVGIELDKALLNGGSDGFWRGRKLFDCPSNHGLIVPITEIQKFHSKSNLRQTSFRNHLDLKLEDSQVKDFTYSYLGNRSIKNDQNIHLKNQYFTLESKINEQTFKKWTPNWPKICALEFNNTNRENRNKIFDEVLENLSVKQQLTLLKSKNNNAKLSLKKKRRKGKTVQKSEFIKYSNTNYDHKNVKNDGDNISSFIVNEFSEKAQTLDSKAYLKELMKSMNDVGGYFKEIKDDEKYENWKTNKPLDEVLFYNMPDSNCSAQRKEKSFFSFLKWFKKNKEEPNLKLFKESSAASSPMFVRKGTASCESIDTLFSTQTVRSFAYVPPTQYEPSAPPSNLLNFDNLSQNNIFENFSQSKNTSEEIECLYDKRKKRKAPQPPRLSRENSLPTTLEYKKNDDQLNDGMKTYHRRTVSESFKDKKAGAYCHVQGKRKAPPPPQFIYPNLQKINNPYPSLHKKKKPAPPPPENKAEADAQDRTKQSDNSNNIKKDINILSNPVNKKKTKEHKSENIKIHDLKAEGEKKNQENGSICKGKFTKDVSLSPLPSRPWYKRNHRDSNGSNIIKKELLKGFEWKKNKESEDWMPEVGFSRRSLLTDNNHNKFNIFARLEKNDDKKKEEKRKSQISILTNISELDREAAEIVRKEQAEEKKIMAENDAKYYTSNSPPILLKNATKMVNDNSFEQYKTTEMLNFKDQKKNSPSQLENFNDQKEDISSKESNFYNKKLDIEVEGNTFNISVPNKNQNEEPLKEDNTKINIYNINKGNEKLSDVKRNEELPITKNEEAIEKENLSNTDNQSNEKIKQNFSNALIDVTNSSISDKISKPSQSNLNYFSVENKEVNYLNDPWVCEKCTLENPGWRVFCETCSFVKPRFLYNAKQKTQSYKPLEIQLKQESLHPEIKTQSIKSPEVEELKLIPKKFSPKEIEENKNENIAESLEELRKKRMTFFSSKKEASCELNKSESIISENELDKIELKKILKEMKDSIPRNKAEEKNNIKNFSLLEKNNYETTVNGDIKKEEDKKKNELQKISTQIKPLSFSNQANDGVKYDGIKKKQQLEVKGEEVAEAYIVTKTTVLEDIIIKKADKIPKASTSVQTQSILEVEPEPSIRPPPRTKKIMFEAKEVKPSSSKKKSEVLDLSPIAEEAKKFSHEDLEKLTNKLTQAEGLADFKANIKMMPPNTEMNTVAVNRLLRRLEAAINNGDHFVAAGLAKEIAMMKINCSVTRQLESSTAKNSKITIELYVEDKTSHQGPIPIQVSPSMTLLDLKKKVQQGLGIPIDLQKWILGKRLATDDNKTLESDGIKTDSCAVFLYLASPEKREVEKAASKNQDKNIEIKESECSLPTNQNITPTIQKGWYFNDEDGHFSYCEDSEDSENETRDLSPNSKNESASNLHKDLANTSKNSENSIKKLSSEEFREKKEVSVFDLKSQEAENNVDKELKFISRNSVKQKIEKLNKTLAENGKLEKTSLKFSQSLENWKCIACSFVNSSEKFYCSACNTKKVISKSNFPKTEKEIQKLHLKTSNNKLEADHNVHYKELMELQNADLVPNIESFNCSICMVDYTPGEGVTLKDCLHTFCRTCLINTVQFSEDAEVKCPYLDEMYSCTSVLQQREIKALVPKEIFELHLAKSIKEAEHKIGNAFHCKTPDCKGWCIYEDNVNEFQCPVCKCNNCLTCQTIHNGINCREYQERMKNASETDADAKKTRDMLEEMVKKGEAMACPKCQVVLMKKWGCDWLRCSMCKTEICWVTRGFRWGPKGKGDTSEGCKCGVNGVKCHPKCNYCH